MVMSWLRTSEQAMTKQKKDNKSYFVILIPGAGIHEHMNRNTMNNILILYYYILLFLHELGKLTRFFSVVFCTLCVKREPG